MKCCMNPFPEIIDSPDDTVNVAVPAEFQMAECASSSCSEEENDDTASSAELSKSTKKFTFSWVFLVDLIL